MSTNGPGAAVVSIEEHHEKAQIAFTAAIGCITLVACAAVPFLTYAILTFAAANLVLSLRLWTEDANLANPPVLEPLDSPTKVMITGFVSVVGILFLQLNPLSQIIVSTAFGTAVAAYFVHECILGSQIALNAALRAACSNSQLDDVNTLLAKHASPFAPDARGNNAFFHAEQNNEESVEILQALQTAALKTPLTIKEVLANLKGLLNDDISQKWQQIYQQLKQCIETNSRDNRAQVYEACHQVLLAYHAPLKTMVNALALYLREKLDEANDKTVPPLTQVNELPSQRFEAPLPLHPSPSQQPTLQSATSVTTPSLSTSATSSDKRQSPQARSPSPLNGTHLK